MKDMHLCLGRQVSVDIIDLLLETLAEHLICLIKHQHFDVSGAEGFPLNHIKDSAWGPRNYMHSSIQSSEVIACRNGSSMNMFFRDSTSTLSLLMRTLA